MVRGGSAAKLPSKARTAPGESAGQIRKRLAAKLEAANPSSHPGGEGPGPNPGGDGDKFAWYLGALEDKIQVAWEQPPSAAAGLMTTVQFSLEPDGRITGAKVSQSSGNAEMDQSALLAVKSIGQYERWPEGFPLDRAKILVDFECKPNQ